MGLLTKIEETPDKFDFKSVDLHDVVEKVRTDLKDDIAANGVTFRNDLPVGTTVSGNESLLYSIFRNLADNAVKHAGRDIDVVVGKIADGGKTVAVSFADTGRGIADEKGLSRIFERFYRIDEGRTRENGGSGLGLSIVKNAVLIHGGDITARNRDGGGLEFIIHLPV